MALHLNLHHEIERQRLAQSRDPLKLAMYGLAGIATFLAGYYVLQFGTMAGISRELARKTEEFKALGPKAEAAKKREGELAATIKASGTLVRRIEERFYWAPLLEQLSKLVPPEVQITRFSGDVEGDVVKKCVLKVDGMAAGADARGVAEELRTAIEEEMSKRFKDVTSTFRTLEDSADTVKLNGKHAPSATFAIQVRLATAVEVIAAEPIRQKR